MQALGARGACRRTCVGARARAQVGLGARRRWGARSAGGRAGVGFSDPRGARQAQAGARGAAGWAASAHLGVLNWARLGFCAP